MTFGSGFMSGGNFIRLAHFLPNSGPYHSQPKKKLATTATTTAIQFTWICGCMVPPWWKIPAGGERQRRASYSCPPGRVSPGNLTEAWRRAPKRVKLARHSTRDRRSTLAHLTHVTHSQMLETRRRRKRGKKDLAGAAKRAKKLAKWNARKARAGAPKPA